MSASIKPLSLEEFLDWERAQPLRYEFDGIQPIPMGMKRADFWREIHLVGRDAILKLPEIGFDVPLSALYR